MASVGFISIHVDFGPLNRFREKIIASLINPSDSGPIRDAFKQWAMRFRSFLSRRFDTFSKGGGDWPPISRATKLARARRTVDRARAQAQRVSAFSVSGDAAAKAARSIRAAHTRYRKEKMIIDVGGGRYSILRDRGFLFMALAPQFVNSPGAIERQVRGGIEVGYGGPAIHPEGKTTIAQIASFHQKGGKHLPKREIIVPPDDKTIKAMEKDMARAVKKIADDANAGK